MQPLLHHCLSVFDKICLMAIDLVFFSSQVTLIKIVSTPLDISAALVLSVIK